jgi:hypothetical protein
VTFGSRSDGGPTSWQARILNGNDSYREFMLEYQDLQLAYTAPDVGNKAINPPSTPSLITTGIPVTPAGTQSVNYTNDPIGYRIGQFADISYAYDNNLQQAPNLPPNGDPVTPLMRAYENDKVQVRVLVGAHVFAHQFNLEGPTWFSEPSWKNSGYRSAQAMGLSEHFELLFKVPPSSAPDTQRKCPDGMSQANCVDYMYSPSLDVSGLSNGLWGLFRSYVPTQQATNLAALPNNPIGAGTNVPYATCKDTAPRRVFNITAVTAQKALAGYPLYNGNITFNSRGNALVNPLGVMYVRSEDLDAQGKLKTTVPVEPLILRANAGDCIEVNLTNSIATSSKVNNFLFQWAAPFNTIPVNRHMSRYVGLHPQLLSYDSATSNGMNVGWNSKDGKNQIVPVGKTIKYEWYAGKIDRAANGTLNYTPVEFGALNLFPSDPLFQHLNGLFGQMIIEPPGATWQCDGTSGLVSCEPSAGQTVKSRASATVTLENNTGKFREFALMISDNIRMSDTVGSSVTVANNSAINYRAEPWQFRYAGNTIQDFSCMLSNQLIGAEPQTPIFTAEIGDKVRFRLTHPFGTGTSQVFSLHGHVWQRNPYQNDSTVIGDNKLSQWLGSRDNHGSTDHFDMLVDKAGGEFGQAGDYLYTTFQPLQAREGPWGIFRVGHASASTTANGTCKAYKKSGYVPPPPKDGLDRFLRPSLNTGKP